MMPWIGSLVASLFLLGLTGGMSAPAYAAQPAATTSPSTYVDPTLGFSFQIPAGWVVTSHNHSDVILLQTGAQPGVRMEINPQRYAGPASLGTPATLWIGRYPAITTNTPGGVQVGYPCLGRLMVANDDLVDATWCGPNVLTSPIYAQQFESMLATYHDHASIYRTSHTSMAPNPDGRLEAFTLGADQNIWYTYQTTPGGYWAHWTPMLPGYTFSGQPVVSMNSDGHLEVFVRANDNTIYHSWQTTSPATGTSWTNWVPLQPTASPHFQGNPSVAMNGNGRLEIVARDSANQIWHNYQTSANGTWHGWTRLANILDTNDPVIVSNDNSMLEIFACGGDHHLSTAWEMTNGSSTSWSNWVTLPSATTLYCQGTPSAALNADGRLEVIARDADGSLWHNYQLTANGAWSGWAHLTTQKFQGDPMIGANANGMLEIFARGSDNHIWTAWQNTAGSSTSWSNWVPLPSAYTPQFQGTPALALNADGRLKVSSEAIDGSMWSNIQTTPNGSWSGWGLFHLDPTLNGSN